MEGRQHNSFVPLILGLLCCCLLTVPARAQQPQPPEDPEDEKQVGLWLDQGVSADLSANKSLVFEFHERFDEGASNYLSTSFREAWPFARQHGSP